MIPKQDLRIGNSVSYKGEIWKVEELADTAAHLSQHPLWVRGHYENIQPIPITEEALVKMGFEAKGIGRIKDFLIIWKEENPFVFAINEPHTKKTKSIEISSIHQLQNLYYALTQTELTYD